MIPPFAQNLRSALQKNRSWSNLNPSAIAATVVSLIGEGLLDGPIWIVTPTEKDSQILYQNLETWWFQQGFGNKDWSLNRYPADDVQVLFGLPPNEKDTQQRLKTLILNTPNYHTEIRVAAQEFMSIVQCLAAFTVRQTTLKLAHNWNLRDKTSTK